MTIDRTLFANVKGCRMGLFMEMARADKSRGNVAEIVTKVLIDGGDAEVGFR